jgi:muramidase (phage lysozyme)
VTLRDDLSDALQHPNVRAFLRAIRAGESSQDDIAYRMMVGGDLFGDMTAHPNVVRTARGLPQSTAAGAYQFLYRTWQECREALDLPNFGPNSQDVAAVYLIRRRGALADVLAGRFESAIAKCANEWASLPGSPYGQPTRTLEQLRAVYVDYGGAFAAPAAQAPPAQEEAPSTPPAAPPRPSGGIPAGEAADWGSTPPTEASPPPAPPVGTWTIPAGEAGVQENKPMAPILAGIGKAIIFDALPNIIAAIPRLGSIFTGPNSSEVARRNVQAVSVIAETIGAAVGAANAQATVEALRDPAKLQAARDAVDQRWGDIMDLVEAGGGGIDGARKADAAAVAAGDMLRSPSFWIALALLPLVYMIVANVVGVLGKPLSDEVRSAISNGVVGLVLGGLIGYYYGQTTTRNRSPAPQVQTP